MKKKLKGTRVNFFGRDFSGFIDVDLCKLIHVLEKLQRNQYSKELLLAHAFASYV